MVEMEPIVLVTGLPGAGKTLFAIDLLRKCTAEGLRCYNFNVNQLDPEIAEQWENSIENWADLPQKSVLVVDEAHSVFPVRPSNAQNPPHIAALAEIRHKGIRLILIDQDPSTLDRFVKRRVGSHYHLVNRTGFDRARVFSNRGCVDNPRAVGAWSVGESDLWKYPKELFTKYKSASVHIKKARIPKRVWWILVALLVVVASFWWMGAAFTKRFSSDPEDHESPTAQNLQTDKTPSTSILSPSIFENETKRYSTPEEWLKAHVPLVDGVPWSAPIFASREPTTTPDLLCVVIGDVDSWQAQCRCFSEQVTVLEVDKAVCLKAARYGVYNPYRASMSQAGFGQTPASASGRAVALGDPARPPQQAAIPYTDQQL